MGAQKSDTGPGAAEREALQLLRDVSASIAERHAEDDQDVRACLQAVLETLSEQERDRLAEAFRRILGFQPPPSRSSQ